MLRCLVCGVGAVVLALALPIVARADEAIASVTRPTPVVAAGDVIGWLTQTANGQVLAYRVGDRPIVTTSVVARSDLSAGRDARGRATFVWSDCRLHVRRCTVFGFRPGQRRPWRLARIPRVGQPPQPTLADGQLLTARRFRRILGRPCSAPFVQRLGSRVPARRLRPGVCAKLLEMRAAGDAVLVRLDDMFIDGGNSTEQLRLVPLDGRRSRKLTEKNAGERPNTIGGAGRRGRSVTFALPGGPENPSRIGRVDLRTGREREVPAHEALWGGYGVAEVVSPVGSYATVGRSGYAYLRQSIDVGTSDAFCTVVIPCTVVRGSDPFRPRTLAPTVQIDDARGKVSVLTGRVARARVRPRAAHGARGVAGVRVQLLEGLETSDSGEDPTRTAPTGLSAITDPGGRFRVALPSPAYPSQYVVRTADSGVPAVGYIPAG